MLTNELAIFRDSYELLNLITDVVAQIPKIYRPTIGNRALNITLDLVHLIGTINRLESVYRLEPQNRFLVSLDTLGVLLRLMHEKKMISTKRYSHIVSYTSSIGKQMTGWKKDSANR